ncbi:MAG: signal peptidase I [Desulfobulbaceae bacterium]|nr:signal peptidase I [Desulfobulbaceae bacterium]
MKKFRGLILGCITLGFIVLVSVKNIHPEFVVNMTESMPVGLYFVVKNSSPVHGDIVVFPPPEMTRKMIYQRHWLPRKRGFLLKPVIALPGDYVCTNDDEFVVNDESFGNILEEDRKGRELPKFTYCDTVNDEEIFVGVNKENSFDSRYFGPLSSKEIVGRAMPVITW